MDALLGALSGAQLTEWIAYAQLEPFGEERADLRMSISTAALGNIMYQVWTGKNRAPFKVEDFMPQFEKQEPMSKDDAILAIDAMFTALAAATKDR